MNTFLKKALLASVMLVPVAVVPMGSVAYAQTATRNYSIAAQSLGDALRQFAAQSGRDVVFDPSLAQSKTSKGVHGALGAQDALARLLEGTGLKYVTTSTGFAIRGNGLGAGTDSSSPVGEASPGAGEAASSSGEGQLGQDIVVTGTNIRGIAPESSPTRTFSREDIQNSGAATAQDFIQTLTANFGGGSNADIPLSLPNDDSTRHNRPAQGGTHGSSVNLRGLGSGSTLVLLNGHRLAPSSGIGDFVDISMIPASALERVEVLTDGASSIYGSDAVAGVVNFIMRDDFDGAEASFRYGAVTEGDMDEYRASATVGKAWGTGHALVVYEYFNQGNLSAADRSFSQGATLPSDLLPSQERHSVLASASQELTPDIELSADFIFSRRETDFDSTIVNTGITTHDSSESNNWSISAGGSWKFGETWFLDFSGTYANVSTATEFFGTSETMRQVDSEIWTADARTSGSVLLLPGGEVKLALGGHYRAEDFSNTLIRGSGTNTSANRDVYAFFGEAFIPIVGSDNAMRGIKRLEVNASGRFDHFSDFGSTANPKVGVLWSPLKGLNFRGSYSTSFNPPPLGRVGAADLGATTLPSAFLNNLVGLTPGDPSIANVDVITVSGTGKDLEAETSRAFTVGADFYKQWGRHNLTAKVSWFDIKFENRLGDTPCPTCVNGSIFDVPNIAFNNPELFPEGTVIFFPSAGQITDVLNSLDRGNRSFFGADPLNASIINFANVVRNLSLTFARGIDFYFAYTYDSDVGRFLLGLDGTFLENFQQQAAVTTPLVEQINTLYNPVDLKLRGRVGYVHEGFAANIFVNYVDGYRVDNTVGAASIGSWTTADISLSFDTRQKFDSSLLQNAVLRLSVINLFKVDPPSAPGNPALQILGYDPANASPLGRFVAFELTKRF